MPEFRSRIDSYRWQTPAFREVFSLDDLSTFDEKLLEATRLKLEDMFNELNMPLSLSAERLMPSYTCYDAKIEQVADIQVLQDHIYEIENQEGWIIGFEPLNETELQLFLRTGDHYPLNWKHVVTRITFRKANAATSFVIGVNLEQQTLIQDWDSLQHFLIIGSGGSKQSVVRNIIITAMMLNTPSEFRFALIGHGSDDYRYLQEAPHMLGSSANSNAEQGCCLIRGMGRELKRRQSVFERLDVADFEDCNVLLEDNDKAILPRLVLICDTLNHVDWIKKQADWMPIISELLDFGAQYGIHLLLTAQGLHLPYPFDEINDRIPNKLISRSAAVDTAFMEDLGNLHPSLLRFIDSFLLTNDTVHPIELPAITAFDIRAVISYWKQNVKSRYDSINNLSFNGDGSYSVHDLVRELVNEKAQLSPPIPEKPSAKALARAAEVLSEEERKTDIFAISDRLATNGDSMPDGINDLNISVETIHRAQALATYLGWLGKGPLMDVLGLSVAESGAVIAILQARQILERGTNPTPHLHFKRRR